MVAGNGSMRGDESGTTAGRPHSDAPSDGLVAEGAVADGAVADGAVADELVADESSSGGDAGPARPTPPAYPPAPYPPYQAGTPSAGYPSYGYPPLRPPRRRRRIWPYVVAAVVLAPLLFVSCAYVVIDRVTDRVAGTAGPSGAPTPPTTPLRSTKRASPSALPTRPAGCARSSWSRTRPPPPGPTRSRLILSRGTERGSATGSRSSRAFRRADTSTPVQATDAAFAPAGGYTCSVATVTRV